jgi:hypothetical protein
MKSLYKAKAMRTALSSPDEMYNKFHFALDNGGISRQHSQTAVEQRSGLVPRYPLNRRQSSLVYEIMNEDEKAHDNVRIPSIWGFTIEGDAGKEGLNTFPYRFFSSWQSSDHIMRGFESLCRRLKNNQVPDDNQDTNLIFHADGLFNTASTSDVESLGHDKGVALTTVGAMRPAKTWDSTAPPENNLRGSPRALDRYLELDVTSLTAYPEWKEITRSQWIRFISANIFGLVVQWGTSGPAIYVMFYSPPVVSFSLLFHNLETN